MAKATKAAAPKKAAKKKVDRSPSKKAIRTRKPATSLKPARRSNKPNSQAWERGEAIECAPNQ